MLMGSQSLMLENRSQSFIEIKNKSLSCSATDKERTRVFLQAEQCCIVFFKEHLQMCLVSLEL